MLLEFNVFNDDLINLWFNCQTIGSRGKALMTPVVEWLGMCVNSETDIDSIYFNGLGPWFRDQDK